MNSRVNTVVGLDLKSVKMVNFLDDDDYGPRVLIVIFQEPDLVYFDTAEEAKAFAWKVSELAGLCMPEKL